MKKNYYEILSVNQDAQSEEIKKSAYRQLNEISQAFKTLSDIDKRQAYDLTLQTTPLPTNNYYDLLGVNQTTPTTIIKQAVLAQLNEIKVALEELSNPEKRQAYDLTLQSTLPLKEISPYRPPATLINDTATLINDTLDDKDIQKENIQKLELANRTTRLGAVIIDVIIFSIPVILVIFLNHFNKMLINTIFYSSLFIIIIVNLILLYQYGQTISKKLLFIKIVRSNGSRAGLRRIILLRVLLTGLLTNIPKIGGIIYFADIILIFKKDRRCLHDIIADTLVIKTK